MDNAPFSPDDSLRLIRNMINKTREGVYDNSKYFLVWGWGAFLACIGQFVLKVVFHRPDHYKVWYITLVCLVITVVISLADKKREKVKTYVGESMGYLWSGLGISFTVLFFVFIKMGFQYCYPFYILLYGLGTFVSGQILKYKPLIIGGIISFVLAAWSVWYSFDYQMLFAAAALLVSYIIPAHMLRQRFRKERLQQQKFTQQLPVL